MSGPVATFIEALFYMLTLYKYDVFLHLLLFNNSIMSCK